MSDDYWDYGYYADPEQWSNEIMSSVVRYSPVRSVPSVQQERQQPMMTIVTEDVALSDIREMPEWTTDPETVETFAGLLKAGKPFSSLSLRKVVSNGKVRYEIIDGFHRYRALQAIGATSYPATIRECDDREAMLDRIEASMGKPTPLLAKRAFTALCELFVSDVRGKITGQTALQRVVNDDGTINVVARAIPENLDTWNAMLLLLENENAHQWVSDGSATVADSFDRTLLEGDEDDLLEWKERWLYTVGDRLHIDGGRLLTVLFGEHKNWANSLADLNFDRIVKVPDEAVRNALFARFAQHLRRDFTFGATNVFQYLGVDFYFPSRGRALKVGRPVSEILKLLAQYSIEQLETMGRQAQADADRIDREIEAKTQDLHLPAQYARVGELHHALDAIYSVGSTSFVSDAEQKQREKDGELQALLGMVRGTIQRLKSAERVRINWSDPTLQAEMSRLVTMLQAKVKA